MIAVMVVPIGPAAALESAPPPIDSIGEPGAGDGQFSGPFGIDVAADGTWWVADYGNDRIQHFSQSGDFLGKFGTSGTGPGQFDGPNGIDVFVDPATHTEQIAVADHLNDRVQIVTKTGTHVRTISSVTGATPTSLNKPADVYVTDEGVLYVAERLGNRVLRLQLDGDLLTEMEGTGPFGAFFNPTAIALSPDGARLYVAETGANRIRTVNATTGGYISNFGDSGPADERVSGPYGLVVDPIGFVYVGNSGSSTVMKFAPGSGFIWSYSSAAAHHDAITPNGWIAAADADSIEVRDLCTDEFPDVGDLHAFFFEICWMAAAEVTTGYLDGTFRPLSVVTRQAMAAFVYRLFGEPPFTPPVTATFDDVPTDHPFFKEIEWMVDLGITTGYPDGTFRPGDIVSRQAMSAFMYRAAEEPTFTPPGTPTFDDVGAGHPFYKAIEWMADEGISTGYPDDTYRPTAAVTRQAMSAFMARLRLIISVG
jgi:sugar lactone lactonase YvrE